MQRHGNGSWCELGSATQCHQVVLICFLRQIWNRRSSLNTRTGFVILKEVLTACGVHDERNTLSIEVRFGKVPRPS